MTLNDLKRRNSLYFAFFSLNSTDFQADYITMVVNLVSQFQSSTFGENYNAPCSAVSAIAEHLVYIASCIVDFIAQLWRDNQ